MYPSVADVLALPVVRQGAPDVLVGGPALDAQVRWVHSAEIADIAHLLRGGELVLTTGIALPDDVDGLTGYVQALSTVGAVGLVVELVRRWTDTVPPPLVDACAAEKLPLVVLRREVSFAAVAQTVGERIVDAQLAELRAAEQVHEVFTGLSVEGATPAEILAEVARFCGLPVVLESFRHQVLGFHPGHLPGHAGAAPAAELLADWERRSSAVHPGRRTAYDHREGWLVTVVGARGDDWGRLVLPSPEPPPHRHVVLAERAAAALALHRLQARERDGVERQAHATLLAALAAGDVGGDLLTRCAGAGVPLSDRRLVGLAVRPQLVGETSPVTSDQALGELAAATAAATRSCGVDALVAVVDDDVRVLLSHPPTRDTDAVVDEVAREIVHHAGSTPALVAAGAAVEEPSRASRTLAEAAQVAAAVRPGAAAAGAGTDGPLVHRLEAVHVRGLLHLFGDDERLRLFVERELGPLLRHGAAPGRGGGVSRTGTGAPSRTGLLDVVRALLDHPESKAAAAASLHLSRPAFYERLAKAERALGASLADPEVRTSLHLALLAHDAAR